MKTLNTTTLVLCFLVSAFTAEAQTTYDNNYDTLYFGGNNSIISNYPSNSNGTAQGDVVLYENITIIGGDTIDCYVITQSVTSGTNISNFDKAATTGASGSIIEDRFFAPQMTFPSGSPSGPGGEVEFYFQFIEHGSFSYNSGTGIPSGTPVVLTNVRVNAYDIDGNSNQYSNEYVQFADFEFSELDENTTVKAAYDHSTGYTTFGSATHLKNMDATDDKYRVVVNYDSVSSMQIHVLSGSTNYVFIDFGPGLAYTNTPINYYRLSGMVFDDGDGVQDGIVDGTGIGTLDGLPIYMNLLNSGDSVVRSEPVQTGGYFSFAAVPSGTYSIQTSTKLTAINTTGVEPSMVPLWVNTGEYMGTSTGNDGSPDGILSSVVIPDSITTGIQFGVNKRPESVDVNLSIADPVYGLFVVLGTTGTSILTGSDLEDGSLGSSDSFAITSLPTNGNDLYYNGSKIKYGVDGVNPPSVSNPFYFNYNTSLLQVRFVGIVSNSLSFQYASIDEAGYMDQSPATYTLTWTLPVPITLMSFEAEESIHIVTLNWSTSMERDAKEFIIERMDENGNTDIIGSVAAAGTSNDILNYSFIDANVPANAGRLMYRLRSVDFNGTFEYSEWRSVEFGSAPVFTYYPNPATDHVTVDLSESRSDANVQVSKMDGSVVFSLENANGQVVINTEELASGMYLITVTGERVTHTKKLLVE